MKNYLTFIKFLLSLMLACIAGVNLSAQFECLTEDEGEERSGYSCDDHDSLTVNEILAMPLLNIPVVFHFVQYGPDSNFTCDINDPILEGQGSGSLLYAPTFVYYVMNEMNGRMSDRLLHTGIYSDTRVRYYLLDPTGCNSFYFHTSGSFSTVINALNIVFTQNTDTTISGGTSFNNPRITINNVFRSIYIRHNNATWDIGRLINHENGHRFSLSHTFYCSNPCRGTAHDGYSLPLDSIVYFDVERECCNSCRTCNGVGCAKGCFGCSPKMMAYGSDLDLTPCEHRLYWSSHLRNPLMYQSHCNDSSKVDTLIYDTGTKLFWKGQRLINADVVIKNGTEIEVSCDVQMGADKRIFVERGARLTLNNGHISSLCDYKWNGIVVEGVSDGNQLDDYDDPLDEDRAGTVVLINHSSISEAKTAISMENIQHTWPSFADYYGGLVYCEDSNFFDCDRAVAFMKYGVGDVKDKSKFIGCIFEDLMSGVTLWADNGVAFKSCTFTGLDQRGILAYDSEISVLDANTFEEMPTGLELFSTYPNPFGDTIGSLATNPNAFINTDYGIYGTNQSSIKPTHITKNKFYDDDDSEFTDIGVHFDGSSHFTVDFNFFNSVFTSQELMATGGFDNVVYRNSSDSNTIATHYMYDNLGSTFINNCYSNTESSDIELNHSYVFPIQGSLSTSASNCFTKNSIPSLHCNSHINNVKYYKYGTSCFDPIKHSGCNNISVLSANDVIPILCSTSAPPSSYAFTNDCEIPNTTSGILNLFNSLDGTISSVQASTRYTAEEKYNMILGYQKCQSTLIFKFIELNLIQTNIDFSDMIDSLVTLLDIRTEFIYKINAYGLLVYSGNYSRARQYLNALTKNNQDETDFGIVQNINLNYLTNNLNYTPSQNTLDTLNTIGIKIHPYAGYSRSLYHQLTGARIDLEKPAISGIVIPRSSSNEIGLVVTSFPNPANDGSYTVQFKNNKFISSVTIEIFTIQGTIMHSEHANISENSNVLIHTFAWPSNLYYLIVRNEDGNLIYSTKFAVVN